MISIWFIRIRGRATAVAYLQRRRTMLLLLPYP
jgi:hypothetical protein